MQAVRGSNLVEGSFFHQILVKRIISMIAFALFFIANNSKFINFDYTNDNNKKKNEKVFSSGGIRTHDRSGNKMAERFSYFLIG